MTDERVLTLAEIRARADAALNPLKPVVGSPAVRDRSISNSKFGQSSAADVMSAEIIQAALIEHGNLKIASRALHVSDIALKRRCETLGVDWRKRHPTCTDDELWEAYQRVGTINKAADELGISRGGAVSRRIRRLSSERKEHGG